MNFLAHIYLSGDDEEIIFGNFIADAVKGKALNKYNHNIRKGIMIHREIDNFTDNHNLFNQSKRRLQHNYHKFSGVIVDMYYDHFLAQNWSDYSNEDIEVFVERAYRILKRKYLLLPSRYKKILPFMITSNWLVNYSNFNKLRINFENMAKRTSFESGMENAVNDLKKDYKQYYQEFSAFFPDIIEFVRSNWDIKGTDIMNKP